MRRKASRLASSWLNWCPMGGMPGHPWRRSTPLYARLAAISLEPVAGRGKGRGQHELDGLLQRCSLDATTRVNDAPPVRPASLISRGKKDLLVSLVYARQMMFSFWKVVPCFARRPRWHVSSFPAACRGLRRGILFCPPLAWAFFLLSQLTRALALECNAK